MESFFLERYRIYRWLVFHHSVVRGEVSASRALTILLDIYFEEGETDTEKAIKSLLEQARFSRLWLPFSNEGDIREYAHCDESWLFSLFHQIQPVLGDGPLKRNLVMLKIYLDFLLARKKQGFITLWKRAEEYERFCEHVYESFVDALGTLSRSRRKALISEDETTGQSIDKGEGESCTQWFNRVIIKFLKNGWDTGEIETMRKIEDSVQESLSTSGALLLKILRFTSDVKCELIDKTGTIVTIQNLSSIVENLPSTWNMDIQLRAYWVSLNRRRGGLFLSNPSGRVPSAAQLGEVFLKAILGGTGYDDMLRLKQV